MWNIVLVDDETRIVNGLTKIITRICDHFHVIAKFNDSEEAYVWLQQNYSYVDLLITDITMPKLTGLDLIQKVRKFAPHLPCIILTGYAEFEYAQQSITLGVIEYLLKPVDTEKLSNLLNRLILNQPATFDNSVVLRSSLSREVLFIKNEIEKNYQNFDISIVADKLLYNKEYLSRIFKKEVGITISNYLTDIRLEQARRILEKPGEYKIYEACRMVGYEDQIYFTKLFKKKYNITPKEYQKYGKCHKT